MLIARTTSAGSRPSVRAKEGRPSRRLTSSGANLAPASIEVQTAKMNEFTCCCCRCCFRWFTSSDHLDWRLVAQAPCERRSWAAQQGRGARPAPWMRPTCASVVLIVSSGRRPRRRPPRKPKLRRHLRAGCATDSSRLGGATRGALVEWPHLRRRLPHLRS